VEQREHGNGHEHGSEHDVLATKQDAADQQAGEIACGGRAVTPLQFNRRRDFPSHEPPSAVYSPACAPFVKKRIP